LIHFPPAVTTKLNVQLRELTMREAVELAATPLGRHEAAATALLDRIVLTAGGPHSDRRLWTVQERMFIVAHYIACTTDGPGNFELGDGSLLDYLLADQDSAPDQVDVGPACGNRWTVKQLVGAEAIAVEALSARRADWVTADMAARLRCDDPDDPPAPDPANDPGRYAAWLAAQKKGIDDLPESDFEELFAVYRAGLVPLEHLFRVEFDHQGLIVMPKAKAKARGGGDASLSPARFPLASCLGRVASILGA
jgi:hypothetical protein